MNQDFHYYGTYVAARLAGYDFKTAQTIAHAAQYVDDSTVAMLKDGNHQYYISDFTPIPTSQDQNEQLVIDVAWTEKTVNQTYGVWIPFHFLPGNYGDNTGKRPYTGPVSCKATFEDWNYGPEFEAQFRLMCTSNSILAKKMVNDVIQNHVGKEYETQIIGLTMHVLADTWAHKYYAGIPAWFMNNVESPVLNLTDNPQSVISWKPFGKEICTPNAPSYNSLVYLGHGRMGHVPDYPWLKYEYTPQWSSSPRIKDNPAEFLNAFKQITAAMRCIREGRAFDINVYEDLSPDTEAVIVKILTTREDDQCATWKNNISQIKINNTAIEVPEDYDANKWINEMKVASQKNKTDYYYFNYSAVKHLEVIREGLEEADIFVDGISEQNTMQIRLKNKKGAFVGALETSIVPSIVGSRPYPKMRDTGVGLSLIKSSKNPLQSGDIIRIKTTEAAGEFCYLGAWTTPSLYYDLKDYDTSKQSWQIIKLDCSNGSEIKAGDAVYIKNCYYKKQPYMATHYCLFQGDYLTTKEQSSDDAVWILE